ncbi:MAG TPA: hypothetical protein VKT78_12320, partial [Fimbriimonadaceae bacterium]|nr:hypothetical protein [Fimbriimonadaceae bacterium]
SMRRTRRGPVAKVGLTQSCWFAASEGDVTLVGGIFAQDDDGGNPITTVTVRGSTSTPFVIQPGSYRYEFNMVAGSAFNLKLYVHGSEKQCQPSKFDPKTGGTIDRVTRFTID